MAYRRFQLNGHDEVPDDVEDARIRGACAVDRRRDRRRRLRPGRGPDDDVRARRPTSAGAPGGHRRDGRVTAVNNLLPLPVLLPLLGAALALSWAAAAAAAGRVALALVAVVRGRRRRCWSGRRPARPAGAVGGRLAGAAGHRAGRRPAVGADALVSSSSPSPCWSSPSARDERGRASARHRCRSSTRPSWCSRAGVSNAFLAGDLFNLFVGFEILLFASYVLHHPRRHRRADPRRDDLRRGQPARPRCCS